MERASRALFAGAFALLILIKKHELSEATWRHFGPSSYNLYIFTVTVTDTDTDEEEAADIAKDTNINTVKYYNKQNSRGQIFSPWAVIVYF